MLAVEEMVCDSSIMRFLKVGYCLIYRFELFCILAEHALAKSILKNAHLNKMIFVIFLPALHNWNLSLTPDLTPGFRPIYARGCALASSTQNKVDIQGTQGVGESITCDHGFAAHTRILSHAIFSARAIPWNSMELPGALTAIPSTRSKKIPRFIQQPPRKLESQQQIGELLLQTNGTNIVVCLILFQVT